MPLVEQSLFVNLFERPPDRLDVIVVVGDVRMLHIHPITDAVAHDFPFFFIFPDAFFAFVYERLDSVFFYLLLAVYAQQLFHFQLDGQTVGVPARLAQNRIPLHDFVARNYILHDAREDMTYVRLSVCGRRTVVKGERFLARVFFVCLFKNLVFLPKFKRFLFALHKIERRADFFVHIKTVPADVLFSSKRRLKIFVRTAPQRTRYLFILHHRKGFCPAFWEVKNPSAFYPPLNNPLFFLF